MGSSGSRVILEMVKISKDFNLPVNPELMLLQKNMFYVEGIAKNLGYSGNFWGLSKNIMKNWAKENFSIKNRLKQRAEEFLDTSTSLKELISLAKDYYLNKLKKH
jgi:ubiquinone biosynthesis protein